MNLFSRSGIIIHFKIKASLVVLVVEDDDDSTLIAIIFFFG